MKRIATLSPLHAQQIAASPALLWSTIASIISIAFFNSFGVKVTKRLSGAARAAIDACRTLFIWVAAVGLGWEPLSPPLRIVLQVLGFAVLVSGTSLYNELLRACLPTPPRDADTEVRFGCCNRGNNGVICYYIYGRSCVERNSLFSFCFLSMYVYAGVPKDGCKCVSLLHSIKKNTAPREIHRISRRWTRRQRQLRVMMPAPAPSRTTTAWLEACGCCLRWVAACLYVGFVATCLCRLFVFSLLVFQVLVFRLLVFHLLMFSLLVFHLLVFRLLVPIIFIGHTLPD